MGASLGTGNRGVSALGASLVKLLCDIRPDCEVVMLIGNRDSTPWRVALDGNNKTVLVENYRMSPRSPFSEHLVGILFLALVYRLCPLKNVRNRIRCYCPWIRVAVESDLVGDIRGGDSFSDIYGMRGLFLSTLPVIAVIWVRGDIILFPQTYGPYKHWIARVLAKYVFKHASQILSRDKDSIATVESLIGKSPKVKFCPDVAFSLIATRVDDPLIEPPLPDIRPSCLVGLNVNGLMYNGGYTRQNMFGLRLEYTSFLKLLVEALLQRSTVRILLVPHTFGRPEGIESDPTACRALIHNLPNGIRNRVHLVTAEYDQHSIKGIIGMCDFFVGSRMHSCIAALSQGIPTIGVAYSKKFRGIFESVGVGDWVVDGRESTTSEAVNLISARVEALEEMRMKLEPMPSEARSILREQFELLVARSVASQEQRRTALE